MSLIRSATAHCHPTMSATRREGKKIIGDGEIELNLDLIDPRTFGELDGYVRECLGGD